ncbi:MAG: MscS Mechanosensitive ion channel [Clostridia bacterium]|jgi:miniconductance mechanosensitive channel|nr:MscS Mechanosensitive ion channel [Clostridia bacterium]
MTAEILSLLENIGLEDDMANSIAKGLIFLFIILLGVVATVVVNKAGLKIAAHLVKKSKYTWDNMMLEHKVFQRIFYLIPPLIIRFFGEVLSVYKGWIEIGTTVYIICVMLLIFDALLNAADTIYRTFEISKSKPIKGFLQVVKIVIFIIGGIVIISVLIGKDPTILIGGIGALTAVITLVFKDSILGFIAGVQLTANDMVRIGDWIEMPKYSADGVVIDLSLNTIKVENFDMTITTIPAYALTSDSFKNWRGMVLSGGRRIKRSITIDVSSIVFCSDTMLEYFKKTDFLKAYIENKSEEIETYNRSRGIDTTQMINGRKLTNIGVFRIYVQNYLHHHPGIHKEMAYMVRQLAQDGRGLPIEIYAFTNDTEWTQYETIQSDIFDHLFAVLPQFELRAFQEPTGYDVKEGMQNVSKINGRS